jgi:Fe-Mn family superoxide dismutase
MTGWQGKCWSYLDQHPKEIEMSQVAPSFGLPGATCVGLAPLPYAEDALEPVITATTLEFHYGMHHRRYVEHLNRLVAGTMLAELPLETIITDAAGRADRARIWANATQVWAHTLYWNSLRPGGGGEPPAALKQKIEASFGSVRACKRDLANTALTRFGNGWAWLVLEGSKLKTVRTNDSEIPLGAGIKPLIVVDLWSHAYCLDYRSRRADYVNAVLDKLINWEFALQNAS